jgi:hypothetical protein
VIRTFPALALVTILFAGPVFANGYGESGPWQFQTPAQRGANAVTSDLIERKRGGFYDSFKSTYNTVNQTWIDKQVNCSVNASSNANAGSNTLSSSTASPVLNSSADIATRTSANEAYNGSQTDAFAAMAGDISALGIMSGAASQPLNIDSGQSNSGTLSSTVSKSSVSSGTGNVKASGYSAPVLNSKQSNTGSQTAQVSGSTACAGMQ